MVRLGRGQWGECGGVVGGLGSSLRENVCAIYVVGWGLTRPVFKLQKKQTTSDEMNHPRRDRRHPEDGKKAALSLSEKRCFHVLSSFSEAAIPRAILCHPLFTSFHCSPISFSFFLLRASNCSPCEWNIDPSPAAISPPDIPSAVPCEKQGEGGGPPR